MSRDESSRENLISAERRRLILSLAQERGSVNATELADGFSVGLSTIRRDLDALHEQGELIRVHGGAVVKETSRPRRPYSQSRDQQTEEKAAIAQAALAYVPESGTVFLGGGTTIYQLATRIPTGRGLAVVTNALDTAAYVASHRIAEVDLVGGTVRPDSLQTNYEDTLDNLYWDVTFVSPAAIDIRRGITTDNRIAAHQEQIVINHGGKFIVLCDSSKVGRFAYAQVAPVDVVDVFITDSRVDDAFLAQLRDRVDEVVVVDV